MKWQLLLTTTAEKLSLQVVQDLTDLLDLECELCVGFGLWSCL